MKRSLPILLAVALVAALSQAALSQENIKSLAPEAFGKLTRPHARFNHDQHNEKAGITDCVVCHHGGANGRIDRSASTEGTPCVECHKVNPTSKSTGLMNAYHKQCIGCHKAKGKGPLACGQCHQR